MKTFQVFISLMLLSSIVVAQTVTEKLQVAVEKLKKDSATKYASFSLYVVNSNSNELVFDYQGDVGLAPASCQKIITSASGFELLGTNYQYKTTLQYSGNIESGLLKGDVFLTGFGDPSLGSWRFNATKDSILLSRWIDAFLNAGIKRIDGNIYLDATSFTYQPLPGGWVWDDIGNYYGAGTWGLNWRENQYDVLLQSGNQENDEVFVIDTKPALVNATLKPVLVAGKKGSGDNAYIYLPPNSNNGFIDGTIPAGENKFVISGAIPNPIQLIKQLLQEKLANAGITYKSMLDKFLLDEKKDDNHLLKNIYTHSSPSYDSLNYWFMKRSINLYGEAFIKTFAYQQQKLVSTQEGVKIVQKLWQSKGIDPMALNIVDGSGLSPQNRITTKTLVQILQYAKNQTWYPQLSAAFPLYNGMKLKSGTIHGVKSFAGYHTSKNGTNYTLAIIMNNFNGKASDIVKKMYLVLDELK
ncbi:MAG: D-alanyl-D-alanine carboxypeptidase/D-alanyl-D-alanine endopeptidase [Chitinophagaceae bacterium]